MNKMLLMFHSDCKRRQEGYSVLDLQPQCVIHIGRGCQIIKQEKKQYSEMAQNCLISPFIFPPGNLDMN